MHAPRPQSTGAMSARKPFAARPLPAFFHNRELAADGRRVASRRTAGKAVATPFDRKLREQLVLDTEHAALIRPPSARPRSAGAQRVRPASAPIRAAPGTDPADAAKKSLKDRFPLCEEATRRPTSARTP